MSSHIRIPRRSLYSFGGWLILGALIGFVLLRLFTPETTQYASAQPNLSHFDPDVHPALDVSHTPPVILRSDETAHLEFLFGCPYLTDPAVQRCRPEATLYTAWGDGSFQATALGNSGEAALDLPASDSSGGALRYYIEAQDTPAGVAIRYPIEGFIEPTVVLAFIPVNVPAATAVSGEAMLHLPWGTGEGQVGLLPASEAATVGPDAIEVGPDGRIAILDQVNRRVVLADPKTGAITSFAAPLGGTGDVGIDAAGQIVVLDTAGVPDPSSGVWIPQLYRFTPNGNLVAQTPIYAQLPGELVGTREVIDHSDARSVVPFNAQGNARSRADQRASRGRPTLRVQFVDARRARLEDTARGLVFEVSSETDLGAIALFRRVQKGYLAVFDAPETLRIVWFDRDGTVIRNVSIPGQEADWVNPYGQASVGQDGTVYILMGTAEGIDILRVPMR